MKELSNKQMEVIYGGGHIVTKEEYCATAKMIIENNDIAVETMILVKKICNS